MKAATPVAAEAVEASDPCLAPGLACADGGPRAQLDPLIELEERSWRLACVVRAVSRRRDARRRRARILLALLAMRPPPGARGWQRWYVPGAVARLGADGLRRVWHRLFGEEPPSERAMRLHLKALEQARAIVRSPGDWMPGVTREGRPLRWPDTFHLLETDADADWWARVGHPRAAAHPRAAWDPRSWRRLFASWRTEARQLELFPDERAPLPAAAEAAAAQTLSAPEAARPPDLADRLRAAARAGAAEVLTVMRAAGAPVLGRNGWALAAAPARTCGAAALLARALERGDRVRGLAAWLVAAARRAPGAELAQAAPWVARKLPRGASSRGATPRTHEGGPPWSRERSAPAS